MNNPEDQDRLKFLRIAVAIGLIAGIVLSFELWFPVSRTFPRAPLVFGLPKNSIIFFERLLGSLLFVSIFAFVVFHRFRLFSVMVLALLLVMIALDQMRLQPWVYQYLLILIVFAFQGTKGSDEPESVRTLGLIQILIASLYIWSGIQKLGFSFSSDVLPFLLDPVISFVPVSLLSIIGLGIAVVETLIGVGLLFRKTRALAVCMAVSMHILILLLLIAQNYNTVVWAWNAALIAMVIIAFWKSDISIGTGIFRQKELTAKFAALIVIAAVFLPLLSFAGLWDSYLSGALYSGRTEVGVLRLNDELNRKLPRIARENVITIQDGNEKMLPLFEWSMADLNVPVYPERRVFTAVAREVCGLTDDKTDVELVVRSRPGILDGRFEVERVGCGGED